MNNVIFPEDVINIIQSFMMDNYGDESTVDILVCVGAELLGISPDSFYEMIPE